MRPVTDGDASLLVLDLIACPPAGFAAEVLSPLPVRQFIAIDRSARRTIVLRALANSLTIDVGAP
jgi:hypothetical protein